MTRINKFKDNFTGKTNILRKKKQDQDKSVKVLMKAKVCVLASLVQVAHSMSLLHDKNKKSRILSCISAYR